MNAVVREAPNLALLATSGRDIAPDVVYAVQAARYAQAIGACRYVDVRSRPVLIMRTSREWSVL